MTTNFCVRRVSQRHGPLFAVDDDVSGKGPCPCTASTPVASLDPPPAFASVPAFGPLPEQLPDLMVEFAEDDRRDGVAVVIDPPLDDRIQHPDQVTLLDRLVSANDVANL